MPVLVKKRENLLNQFATSTSKASKNRNEILHVEVDCFKAMKSDTSFVLHLCLLHSSDDADHKKYSTLNKESRRCYMSIHYTKKCK